MHHNDSLDVIKKTPLNIPKFINGNSYFTIV